MGNNMEKYKFELAMLDLRLAFLDHDHLEKFTYLISKFFSEGTTIPLDKEEIKKLNFAYVASSICDYDLVRFNSLEQLYGNLIVGDKKQFPDLNDEIMITLACGIHDELVVSIDLDSLPDEDFYMIVENALIIKMNHEECNETVQYLINTAHEAISKDLLLTFKTVQELK